MKKCFYQGSGRMLKNEDFLKFYTSSQSSDKNNHHNQEKVRYDLKQVQKWDQENKKKSLKKSNKSSSSSSYSAYSSTFSSKKKENQFADDGEYRDRAKERREDVNNDEYESILSQLTAEQTQYLGGDIEHTHLVKGLDYALLKKIRDENELQEQTSLLNQSQQMEEITTTILLPSHPPIHPPPPSTLPVPLPSLKSENLSDINPISQLGSCIKKFLISSKPVNPTTPPPITIKKETILLSSRNIPIIARSTYEYDIDPLSTNDLPTILLRSKDDLRFHTSSNGYDADQLCVPYAISSTLMSKLYDIFHDGDTGIIIRKEKKEKENKKILQISKPLLAPVIITGEPISIFDDVGKYEPTLALQTSNKTISEISSKNYFSNNSYFSSKSLLKQQQRQEGHDHVKEEEEEDVRENSIKQEDLLAPVKQLVAGQMIKQSILSHQNTEIIIEKGKTHRDILGGLAKDDEAEARKRKGGYSLKESNEDVFYDMDDSDDEGGGAKKKKKKSSNGSHGGGSSSGGGTKSSSSHGGHGGGSGSRNTQPPSGLNRAARRALARGE